MSRCICGERLRLARVSSEYERLQLVPLKLLTILHVDSHRYQELPLIPVEEFLAQHPEHANDDENTLMIARIAHEKAEREALEQQRQELLKRKQKLTAENKKRRDDLANLDKDLEKFIDVSWLPHRPLHDTCHANSLYAGCQANHQALGTASVKEALS